MQDKNLLKIGMVGTVITALCCFTPLLVILVSAVGLSAILGVLLLKPKAGDCCVYCSYGTVACPPIQQGGNCCGADGGDAD